MLLNSDKKILIVGLGLIGGGYARGLHKQGYPVYALNRSRKAIDYALETEIIDRGAAFEDEDEVKELLGEADLVVIGLYPNVIVDWIKKNQDYLKSGVIITDVTGVKTCIVYDIQAILRDDLEFISAHPMAGRELAGVENSDDKVFLGANYIVVPTESNTDDAIEICKELGLLLHFGRITVLTPEEHDDMIAFVSQLTHCIAISLMNCSDNDDLANYVGDSFRDLTRIARINENMWTELFLLNKKSLIGQIDNFIEEMTSLRTLLETEDADELRKKMINSTKRRALFDKK